MLVGFSVVSYIERMNISVAARYMMPELGLSQVQMGQIFSAFLVGYAVLQIPLGMFGDRWGPSRVLAAIAWFWAALTLLTGFVPGRVAIPMLGTFGTLFVIRLLLGFSIAGVYPLAARAMEAWQPLTERAFSYSLIVAGICIGSAVTPPAVAWLMVVLGWRQSFYWAAVLSALIALVWMKWGADSPETHPGVSAAERALIAAGNTAAEPTTVSLSGGWFKIVQNSSIRVLCLSYFLTGYVLYAFVFWLYTYLVDVRKFGIVSSGVFASLPFITAGILSPASGVVCDRLTARLGPRWGRRITAIVGPLIASVFLFTGARTMHQYFAVAALSLSFGFQMSAESAVWSTAMDIGGRFTGLTTGIVNTANNLGGVISTALMPILVARFGWVTALDSCAGLAAVGALLWFAVKPDQRVGL
jgi:ACS family glucarate transporter-like MFS transporter